MMRYSNASARRLRRKHKMQLRHHDQCTRKKSRERVTSPQLAMLDSSSEKLWSG